MVRRLIRRVAAGVATIAAVVVITFLLMYVVPGDPARAIAGPRATPEVMDNLRRALRLDDPILTQFTTYIKALLRGDLGYSYSRRLPVADVIRDRIPATLALLAAGTLLQLLFGCVLGLWEGLRRSRSQLLAVANIALLSIPGFSVAFLLLIIFAYQLQWFPLTGGASLSRIVLPAVTLGILGIPYYSTLVSDAVVEAMASTYVRTAVSVGYSQPQIVRRHVLRAAASPVLSLTGLSIATFFSSVVVIEQVFGWPGLGQLQIRAFNDIDRPLLMGTVIVSSIVVVTTYVVIDILRAVVDPRAKDE
jgi:peptide/nickel transport system permease protein